jgi:hypothetical protein
MDAIVQNGTGEHAEPAAPPRPFAVSAEATRPRTLPPTPSIASERVSAEVIRWIVAHAMLAPSAHNSQPWEFVWRGEVLECRHDPSHDLPTLDYDHAATWATFGAVAENIEMAARALGLEPVVRTFPDAGDARLVCSVSFATGTPRHDQLLPYVPRRVTNRARGARSWLDAEVCGALSQAARSRDAELELVTGSPELEELGALLGACDRLSTMNEAIHRETMRGFRWTPEEVEGRDNTMSPACRARRHDRTEPQLDDWDVRDRRRAAAQRVGAFVHAARLRDRVEPLRRHCRLPGALLRL